MNEQQFSSNPLSKVIEKYRILMAHPGQWQISTTIPFADLKVLLDEIERLDADCCLLKCERDMFKQQRADWKAAYDGKRATVEPKTDDVRLLAHMSNEDFITCLTGLLVSSQMPERLRIYLNEARNRLSTTVPPSANPSDLVTALAHRAVGNQEQDLQNGKLAGYCIVCQVPWPCDTAKHFLRPVQPPVTVPPLDDEVRWILGRPNFACISIAEGLRAGGYVVERKAEHEQAAVIHYMLSMYVKHGMDWRGRAENDLYEMRASVTKSAEGSHG